jgi:hypothetical protein
VTNR